MHRPPFRAGVGHDLQGRRDCDTRQGLLAIVAVRLEHVLVTGEMQVRVTAQARQDQVAQCLGIDPRTHAGLIVRTRSTIGTCT
jgi:hypothetical protein